MESWLKLRRFIALFWLFLCSTASAYWGSFEPILLRNIATITVIDTQTPNIECAKRVTTEMVAPALLMAVGCFDGDSETLIVPLTFGPASIWLLNNFITPNQLLGHEVSHAFRGSFHPALLPFVELRKSATNHDGMVSGEKHE